MSERYLGMERWDNSAMSERGLGMERWDIYSNE
jgi:hypothetical protein